MSYYTITFERQGHVLLIGLNRPEKRNAFSIELFYELSQAYTELENDPELRCGVVYAHGDHFTAGVDLAQWAPYFAEGKFPPIPENGVDPLGMMTPRVSKPIIMAVQGYCFTIGIELLLATDIRVAARTTRFAQIEIKRGIYPVGGATVRLIQEIGWGNAMRYLLTADEFSGDDAYRMGLVQEVTEPGQQLDRAVAIAQTVAAQAPLGVYATLKSAWIARTQGEQAAIDRLLPDLLPIAASDDAREGVMSFMERRTAVFKGK